MSDKQPMWDIGRVEELVRGRSLYTGGDIEAAIMEVVEEYEAARQPEPVNAQLLAAAVYGEMYADPNGITLITDESGCPLPYDALEDEEQATIVASITAILTRLNATSQPAPEPITQEALAQTPGWEVYADRWGTWTAFRPCGGLSVSVAQYSGKSVEVSLLASHSQTDLPHITTMPQLRQLVELLTGGTQDGK